MLDGYFEFCDELPACVGPDGWPLSWRHYVYGMAYIARKRVRRILDMAESGRASSAVKDDFQLWLDERRRLAYRTD